MCLEMQRVAVGKEVIWNNIRSQDPKKHILAIVVSHLSCIIPLPKMTSDTRSRKSTPHEGRGVGEVVALKRSGLQTHEDIQQ